MNVSSTFNANDGDGYNLQMGRWSRRLAEPFLDFADAADGEAILDAGCGTGSLAFALKKRLPACRVNAIDFSPAYIAHAARHAADSNIAFEVGDVCDLRFGDASFDRVLSLLVLHFVPQTARAVAELRRVAKPGGTVAAAVWDAYGGLLALRMFFDVAAMLDPTSERARDHSFTRPMTRSDELAHAWQAAGLVDVQDTSLTIRMDFDRFDDYWAPFEGRDGPGAQHVQTLSADAKARLRDAVRRAYLAGEADGARSFAATSWAVKGRVPG